MDRLENSDPNERGSPEVTVKFVSRLVVAAAAFVAAFAVEDVAVAVDASAQNAGALLHRTLRFVD